MEKMLLRLITFGALLISALPAFALTQLTASVDRNPVLVNESFVLEIVADDHISRDAIDTSVLLKDFVVGQTQTSKATQSINFKTTRTTSWKTTLIARKAGTYIIPPFAAQGVRSKPIRISVVAQQKGSSEQRDIFLKSSIEPKRIYPGQSAVMESRIYVAANLDSGSFTPPEAEGVNFKQMGEAQEKVELLNGRRYRVFINRFVVTADQAGEYTVRPPMFNGAVVTRHARSFFDSNQTRRVTAVDDDIELEVMAPPEGAPQPFIPAEYVTLEEQSPLPEQVKVGDPITRTIAMIATGVKEDMLPAIPYSYPSELNVYPDKVDINTDYQGKSVIASRVESAALIATQPGTITLPEIRVAYWDTRYHQKAEVVLPAHTIEVIAADDQESENDTALEPQADQPQQIKSVTVTHAGYWHWISAGLATLWIWSLIGWWLHVRHIRKGKPAVKAKQAQQKLPATDSWQQLTQALSRYPDSDLSKPLSQWLKENFAVSRLSQLSGEEAKAAQQAYQALQASKFSSSQQSASVEPFKQALTQLKQSQSKQNEKGESFRLYS